MKHTGGNLDKGLYLPVLCGDSGGLWSGLAIWMP